MFLVRDFLDLGRQETITRILSRLATEGLIRRLQQGVYEYPRVSKLLGKVVPPDPAMVAEAMARRTGSQIVPTRAQTANVLGLTTQIQAKNVFLTNSGKPRKVKVGNQTIELRPVASRSFPKNNSESVIQALRFVGEGNITDAIIAKLKAELKTFREPVLRTLRILIGPAERAALIDVKHRPPVNAALQGPLSRLLQFP